MGPDSSQSGPILLVDDDAVVRVLVAAALRHAGFEVIEAANGFAALNSIDDFPPDLILSDVNMPGLSGFELVVRLRANPATASIPVLFMSGTALADSDVDYGLSLGADDYLLKPVDPAHLVSRVNERLRLGPRPAELVRRPRGGLLSRTVFDAEVVKAAIAAGSSGASGVVAVVEVADRERLVEQFGPAVMDDLLEELAGLASGVVAGGGIVCIDRHERLFVLAQDVDEAEAVATLTAFAEDAARRTFVARGERLHVTPAIGLIEFGDDSVPPKTLVLRARRAATVAHDTLDLRATPWMADLGEWAEVLPPPKPRRSRSLAQFIATLILGIGVPFLVYLAADALGYDLARIAYVVVAVALIVTGIMIWTEGILAIHPVPMPTATSRPAPTASAIIAAYMPNEAATIMDTLEAFLRVDYAGDLQVILAYNTPKPLPIEALLSELAAREPRIELLKVEFSTSKAQNVNAALAQVRGEFVGVFDADHHPARDSFTRAWHWLCDEFDVVQGHCVVRNGDVSWVARTIAVEFEAIYAVSHPGRARLHDFGIFGGSNGYWKTGLLRSTRMRGSMLTEDIDSSIRVVENGGRIASDRGLLSRELAPTTVSALWNQRMRWAQGWFQVSIKHLWTGWRSPHLSLRQKLGFTFLLGWRELYPWVSIQMIPIIAFLIVQAGGVANLAWFLPVFVLTSLFTLAVGPGQTLFSWMLGTPEVTRHRSWFWSYLLVSTLLYTEFKNSINRISQMKEFTRERQWKVTPR